MKVVTDAAGDTTVERLSKQETKTLTNAKSLVSQIAWHEDDRTDLCAKAAELDDAIGYTLEEFAKRKRERDAS